MTTQQKKSSTRHGFKTGESIVYPAHGVGQPFGRSFEESAGGVKDFRLRIGAGRGGGSKVIGAAAGACVTVR